MGNIVVALLSGVLFSFGLVLADMTNPARVLAFLDLFGQWDATLLYVLAAAVVTMFIAYRIDVVVQKRKGIYVKHESRPIDRRLVFGSALFGVGWGVLGLCPGPALAGITLMRWEVLLFILSMAVGMLFYQWMLKPKP